MNPLLTVLLLVLALTCFVAATLITVNEFRPTLIAAGLAIWVLVQILALIFHNA